MRTWRAAAVPRDSCADHATCTRVRSPGLAAASTAQVARARSRANRRIVVAGPLPAVPMHDTEAPSRNDAARRTSWARCGGVTAARNGANAGIVTVRDAAAARSAGVSAADSVKPLSDKGFKPRYRSLRSRERLHLQCKIVEATDASRAGRATATRRTRVHNPSPGVPSDLDGRRARAMRTRAGISDALIDLLSEGIEAPSVREVAQRAGVSVRSVFQHYNDMESLYAAMIHRQERRVAVLLEPIPLGLPLYERVRELVERRDAHWSNVAPIQRGIRHHASARNSKVIEQAIQRMRTALSRQTTVAFAAELREVPDAEARIARIEAMTSFEMWDHLRRVQHVSRASVRDQMTAMLLNEVAPK